MAVTANLKFQCTVRETLSNVDAASAQTVTLNGFDVAYSMRSDSDIPATKASLDTIALVAGAKTLDLTALTGINGATVDGTGLKVQYFRVTNNGAAAMTFSEGASNGYALCGASWSHTVGPGCTWGQDYRDTAPDIAAGDKTIDVAGTGTQEFDLTIVMG